MTLSTAVERLWRAVHQLRSDVQALQLNALEDRPAGEPSKLVDEIGTASLTLAGWAEEALDGAARAVAAGAYPVDLARVRQALDACAGATERAAELLTGRLMSMHRLDELSGFGRRGGERRAWVAAIKDALGQVNSSTWAVSLALTDCWRELAERAVDRAPAERPGGDLPADPDAPPTGSERSP